MPSKDLSELIKYLDEIYQCGRATSGLLDIRHDISLDIDACKVRLPKDFRVDNQSSLNLEKRETWSSLMLLLLLRDNGYPSTTIRKDFLKISPRIKLPMPTLPY